MKQVRRQDTAPEMAVRRFLHRAGLRYRLHARQLPGRPDLVLASAQTVVFVHGCFWHGHDCAHGAVAARRNAAYWTAKIAENQARDARQRAALEAAGWQVEWVWECTVDDPEQLQALVQRLLARRAQGR